MNLLEMLLLILVALAALVACGVSALLACSMRETAKRAKGFYESEKNEK